MQGNFWNKSLGFTTFGESHSKGVGVVIEDVMPGIDFPLEDIQNALNKRRPGKNEFTSPRKEADRVQILSGVFEGKTLGTPICLVVYNNDARSKDYKILEELFRPEHADFSYFKKFKIFDYRGGGRASGRETISRVAAGEMVNELLKDIKLLIYPVKIGEIATKQFDEKYIKSNSLYWACPDTYPSLVDYLQQIKANKDSVGGIVEVRIDKIPAGLGDPVFEKLDANLSKAIISIGSVKGIEFGYGFNLAALKGSEANEPLVINETSQKKSGGIYGGITTGEPVVFRFVVKPTPSIAIPQKTVNRKGENKDIVIEGRHDTCIVPRIIPVAEAMIKLVLADAVSHQNLIENKTLNLTDYREAVDKIDEDIIIALAKRKNITDIIAEYKKTKRTLAYNPKREQQLLSALIKKTALLNLNRDLISSIWQNIFEDNRGKQKQKK